jgi:acyl-coenzyme A thioesterase PaaI-like protein
LEQKTHLLASKEFVGEADQIETDRQSTVTLKTTDLMGVDEKGLVHGGFTFGLADYAAMTAVNDPFVVLLSSQARFLKPVKAGEKLTARAVVSEKDGRKRKVRVEVFKDGEERVFEGEFSCLVLQKHVLER